MTAFANALLPSSSAAAALGPKHAMPAARTASATPATSGTSGPITTRSAPSCVARAATDAPSSAFTAWFVATCVVPALPGATWTSVTAGSRERDRASACSRAPPPMTRIFMPGNLSRVRDESGGLAARDDDARHRTARLVDHLAVVEHGALARAGRDLVDVEQRGCAVELVLVGREDLVDDVDLRRVEHPLAVEAERGDPRRGGAQPVEVGDRGERAVEHLDVVSARGDEEGHEDVVQRVARVVRVQRAHGEGP